jgi:pyrimidine-nucleoside phosphorylase
VGDKTTLVVAPIVAACGVKVAKMSGKGLGHTGGTVDKLASIPGLGTTFTQAEFLRIVNEQGLCLAGQSGDLAPADKKLYALRDVTGTVESIPLITASILCKKLASGADCILLDVKTGSGAFMKTMDQARKLAENMVRIGNDAGRKTAALLTNMDRPLGYAIGNALEVAEAMDTLRGHGPEDLRDICLTLSARMLQMAGRGDYTSCRAQAAAAITSGAAYQRFCGMVKAQGGDPDDLPGSLPEAAFSYSLVAASTGYIQFMDTMAWGMASLKLGAGRTVQDEAIDYSAGILLRKKTGDYVQAGEELAVLYAGDERRFPEAAQTASEALVIGPDKPKEEPLYTDV